MKCLVTGASRGIGKAIADALEEAGHTVYRGMRKAEGESAVSLDVTDRNSIEKAVAELGPIDVLVNNAGYGFLGTVEMVSDEAMQQQFDVNVFGLIRMTQAVLPAMRKQKKGLIVNISSTSGVVSNPCLGIYAATKFAVEAITASLATSLFPWNIKAVVVNPTWVNTEFADNLDVSNRLEENPYEQLIARYKKYATEAIAIAQDPKEVGEKVVEVVESEHPDFRNPTSEKVSKRLKETLVDPSGNRWVEEQIEHYSDWFDTDSL